MSGICGYWRDGRGETAPPEAERQMLAAMARPFSRHDASTVQHGFTGAGGAAVAACSEGAELHRQDGLLVALWGRPTLDGSAVFVAARFAALWRERGKRALDAVGGPFALCVLDSLGDQVLLAVDRSGIHPLRFARTRQGLVFASSAAAMLAHPDIAADVDPQSIHDYLYFHMIPAPRTMYRQQQRLLPGECLHYRRGALVRAPYWRIAFDEHRPQHFPSQQAQFLALLENAVRGAIGGHRAGAFLSGGTDSSTLAALLSKASGCRARTYSIGFDVPGYDELPYARVAAAHFRTDHHELYVTAADVAKAIPEIGSVFDEPFGNASALPAYCCARIARADGVTRLLGGDGGDELFGGNDRYARQAVFSRYETLPSALRQLLIEPALFGLCAGRQLVLLRKARSYIRQAMVSMPARLETYNLLQAYGPEQVFEADVLAAIDLGAPLSLLNQIYWQEPRLSQINRMQTLDMRLTLADNDLPKVSKACELAGVEAAFPFLDDALLAFSEGLSPSNKLKGTRLRYFFKRALRGILPNTILRKKKHGFGLPFGHWLVGDTMLRELAFDHLIDLKKRHIVRAGFIDELTTLRLHQHPAYHGTMVWVLMMLEQWYRQHGAAAGLKHRDHHGFETRQG